MNRIKIILTGATGFIGKNLLNYFENLNYEIIKLDSSNGDISINKTWENLPAVDIVIHLAGLTFVPKSWDNPTEFMQINFMGTLAALNFCKKHNSKFIFLSSYLYGNSGNLPITENSELIPTNPYALSKKLSEDLCKFYSDNFKVKVVILRPFNVYGPGQNTDFLIPSIISQAINLKFIKVRDLKPKRDYIYVEDLIIAIEKSTTIDLDFIIMNIGTGLSYSVLDIINFIRNQVDKNIKIESLEIERKAEILDSKADISKAKLVLNWTPKWSLEKGLEKLVIDYNK